jgi:hypothetical protein
MGIWEEAKRKTRRDSANLLEKYKEAFFDDWDVKDAMQKAGEQRQSPYIKRLLNNLKQLGDNAPFGYGSTERIPEHIIEERDNLVLRINTVLNGDIESEIIFLEGEIEKLDSSKSSSDLFASKPFNFETKNQGLNEIFNLFGEAISQSNNVDINQKIAQYKRDIADLKSQRGKLRLTEVDPEKQKIIDEISRVEKHIKANEDTIQQIEQLNIPEPDIRREQNEYERENTTLKLQLLKLKNQLSKVV